VFVGDTVPAGLAADAHVKAATVLSHGLPPVTGGPGRVVVVADLSADPGPWLLRLLLAVNAAEFTAAVPADHPDITGSGWRTITSLVRTKWTPDRPEGPAAAALGPDGRLRLATFTAVGPGTLGRADRLQRWLLDRVHGKLGNVWREGLIRLAAELTGEKLSKRDARAAAERAVSWPGLLDHRLVDLPRHQIAGVLTAAREDQRKPGTTGQAGQPPHREDR
jgi:hypothetical protein